MRWHFQRALLGDSGSLAMLMREISASELLDAAGAVYSSFYFDPVEDPESLPNTLPTCCRKVDRCPMIDTIIGTNFNEALMYIPPGYPHRLSISVAGCRRRLVERIFDDFPEELPVLEPDGSGGHRYWVPMPVTGSGVSA